MMDGGSSSSSGERGARMVECFFFSFLFFTHLEGVALQLCLFASSEHSIEFAL